MSERDAVEDTTTPAAAEVVPLDSAERALSLIRDLEASGALTPTRLDLPPETRFTTYEALGSFLGRVKRSSSWWIGDWLNFGEGVYGEKYAQAVTATGLDEQTLMNYAYVCRSVAPSRRREALPFGVHAEVAPLDPAEQTAWLDRAEEQGWTRADLRAAMREERGDPPAGDDREPRSPSGAEEVLRAVYRDARAADDRPGFWMIPDETMARVRAVVGEE